MLSTNTSGNDVLVIPFIVRGILVLEQNKDNSKGFTITSPSHSQVNMLVRITKLQVTDNLET